MFTAEIEAVVDPTRQASLRPLAGIASKASSANATVSDLASGRFRHGCAGLFQARIDRHLLRFETHCSRLESNHR